MAMVTKQPSLTALTRPSRCSAGGPVTPFEHNWVLYFQTGDYQCGALLINEQWALTAAHCLSDAQGKGIAVSKMKVRVHRHDLKKNNEHKCAETVEIAKKFEHPRWNDRTSANDIALLRLKQVHTTPSHALANIDAVSLCQRGFFSLTLPSPSPLIISTFALHLLST